MYYETNTSIIEREVTINKEGKDEPIILDPEEVSEETTEEDEEEAEEEVVTE